MPSDYWSRVSQRKVSRRRLLRNAAVTGLGLATAAVVGCGSDDKPGASGTSTITRTASPVTSRTTAPTRTRPPATPRKFLPNSTPPATPAPTSGPPTAIINGTLIDGTGAAPASNGWVLMRDGLIESVGSGTPPAHSEYEEVDAAGKAILPGLTDAHVHVSRTALGAEGNLVSRPSEDSLLPFLRDGFTTLRDVGTATVIFSSITNLVALNTRKLKAPEVFWAGPIICTVGGYPISNPRYSASGQEITSPEEGASLVDELADFGARVIKLGIERGYYGDEGWPLLSLEEISAMTTRAHERGLLVTAHVTSIDEVRLALDGGVDDLAHTPLERMPDDVIAEMVTKGVGIVTTATIWIPGAEMAAENAKRFADAGGRVAIGTDFGCCGQIPGMDPYLQELQFLQSYGMTTMQLLTAATNGGAVLANAPDRGTLEAGKRADVIIVDGDPIADISGLRQVSSVFRAGQLVS